MTDKTPSRDTNPKGQKYDPGMLNGVNSQDDFALVLGVPTETIALIVPCDQKCQSKECPFNAIKGNKGFCPIHRKTWYPKRDNSGARGTDWHGPSFLRWAQSGRACCCKQPACIEAGYFPGQPALEIPKEKRNYFINTVCRRVGLLDDKTLQKFIDNPNQRMFFNAWHFHRQHLVMQGGKYAFDYTSGSERVYSDKEGSKFEFPPPNYNVKKFIDEELKPKIAPQDRWKHSDMPAWLWEMLDIDDELRIGDAKSSRKRKAEKDAELSQKMKRRMQSSEARIHCLSNRLESMTKDSDAILSNVNKRYEMQLSKQKEQYESQLSEQKEQYEKEKADTKAKHDAVLLEMKQQYEKDLKEKERELDEARSRRTIST